MRKLWSMGSARFRVSFFCAPFCASVLPGPSFRRLRLFLFSAPPLPGCLLPCCFSSELLFFLPSCSFFFRAAVFLLRCPVPCCLFPLPPFLASFPVRPLPARPLPARPLSSRPLPRTPFFRASFPVRSLSRALSFPRALFPACPLSRALSFPRALFPVRSLSRALSFPRASSPRASSRAPLSARPLFARLAPSFPAYTLPGLNPLPSLSILQPAPRLNGTAADGTVLNGVLMSAQSFSVPLQAHPGRFMLPNC